MILSLSASGPMCCLNFVSQLLKLTFGNSRQLQNIALDWLKLAYCSHLWCCTGLHYKNAGSWNDLKVHKVAQSLWFVHWQACFFRTSPSWSRCTILGWFSSIVMKGFKWQKAEIAKPDMFYTQNQHSHSILLITKESSEIQWLGNKHTGALEM